MERCGINPVDERSRKNEFKGSGGLSLTALRAAFRVREKSREALPKGASDSTPCSIVQVGSKPARICVSGTCRRIGAAALSSRMAAVASSFECGRVREALLRHQTSGRALRFLAYWARQPAGEAQQASKETLRGRKAAAQSNLHDRSKAGVLRPCASIPEPHGRRPGAERFQSAQPFKTFGRAGE